LIYLSLKRIFHYENIIYNLFEKKEKKLVYEAILFFRVVDGV